MGTKTSILGNMTNPMISKVMKKGETSENAVTYNSVFRKSAFFLFAVIIGIVAMITLHQFATPMAIEGAEAIQISMIEAIIFLGALILAVITSILASFIRAATGFFGSISCLCYGAILGTMASCIPDYSAPMLVALVLTVSIVAVLIGLYRSRIVKVTQKFRTIVMVLFFTMILSSLLLTIAYLIPATHSAVAWLFENAVIGIIGAVLGIIIASLFLLCDFDSIEKAVEMKLDKKYETYLAFSLAFSVIWLYFKVLDLVTRLMNNK